MTETINNTVWVKRLENCIKIWTEFNACRGYSHKQDCVFDRFESGIHTLTYDVFFDDVDNVAIIEEDIDLNELHCKLTTRGFTVNILNDGIDVRPQPHKIKLNLKIKPTNNHTPIRPLAKTSNGLPTITISDIANYLDNSVEFNLNHRITFTKLTVKDILSETLESIDIGEDFGVMSCKRFLSQVEKINKILSKLKATFKKQDVFDFLNKKREGEILNAYKDMFSCDEYKEGDVTSLGYTLVNPLEIYENIYRFGSHNKKMAYYHEDVVVIKPFRWEHILFVPKSLMMGDRSKIVSFQNELTLLE